MGYRLQMPGECEERLSDSVAPEHLRGSWQLGSKHRGASPGAGARRASLLNCPAPSLASGSSAPACSDIHVAPAGDDARMPRFPAARQSGGGVSVVGNEARRRHSGETV